LFPGPFGQEVDYSPNASSKLSCGYLQIFHFYPALCAELQISLDSSFMSCRRAICVPLFAQWNEKAASRKDKKEGQYSAEF
jgi:hypothetical protein